MSRKTPETPQPGTSSSSATDWEDIVRNRVSHLRYGTVQITVHEGRVTQVESIEKTRIVPPQETD
jgi:hypothetical protein